jgi:hypothetical protein
VGESADCPAYAGTLLSIARESLEDAKYCFRGGRYRVSLMSAQHALELAAKALLCGCCLATKEELREEVGHRLIAAAKLAWKKLQEPIERGSGPGKREVLKALREAETLLDELDETARKIGEVATAPLTDMKALYNFFWLVGYVEGTEQALYNVLIDLADLAIYFATQQGEITAGKLILGLGSLVYTLYMLATYHLPFEHTYSQLRYELECVEDRVVTLWGYSISTSPTSKLDARLALVEKIINMCPDLCALLKAA